MIATYQDSWAHLSHMAHWWASRGMPYMAMRANALLKRYGLGPARAERRTTTGVRRLAQLGCHPTLPVPGRVVGKHPGFFRGLEDMGVELAMHGYDHVDFRGLSRDEAISQFTRAAAAFQAAGLRFDGFRCPYLSCTNEVREVARDAGCAYSSNSAIEWNVIEDRRRRTAIFDQLCAFYRPSSADAVLSLPRMAGGLVEIPASVPDDLQLCDGLMYDSRAVAATWARILMHTYRRGELFVLVFHPEALGRCGVAIEHVLRDAATLAPAVWVATLRDIARWWMRQVRVQRADERRCAACSRSHFSVTTTQPCWPAVSTARRAAATSWIGTMSSKIAGCRCLHRSGRSSASHRTCRRRRAMCCGSTATSSRPVRTAARCGIYLDAATLRRMPNEVELIEHLERSNAPLVRFWRWPRKARSAMAVTGDLDALSLMDYAQRLVTL